MIACVPSCLSWFSSSLPDRCGRIESSIAFLIFAAAMWAAWRRDPRVAGFLLALGMLFTLAVYLRHATHVLPLSF